MADRVTTKQTENCKCGHGLNSQWNDVSIGNKETVYELQVHSSWQFDVLIDLLYNLTSTSCTHSSPTWSEIELYKLSPAWTPIASFIIRTRQYNGKSDDEWASSFVKIFIPFRVELCQYSSVQRSDDASPTIARFGWRPSLDGEISNRKKKSAPVPSAHNVSERTAKLLTKIRWIFLISFWWTMELWWWWNSRWRILLPRVERQFPGKRLKSITMLIVRGWSSTERSMM